jgi:hypothetical protein
VGGGGVCSSSLVCVICSVCIISSNCTAYLTLVPHEPPYEMFRQMLNHVNVIVTVLPDFLSVSCVVYA